MTNELLEVAGRGFLSLLTLFLVTKLIGKKQVSQLSLFDYVIGISIGNFAAEMTVNLDTSIIYGMLAVIVFGLLAYTISIATMKSISLRRFFMGIPTVIIDDGKLLESALRKVKYDVNDFLEQCREQGYFDISQIAYAVMESSGKISILPKSDYNLVTTKDMNIKKEKASLSANVIIDGNIMTKNLEAIGKNKKWLLKELKVKGKEPNDILLAVLDKNDKLTIYERINDTSKDVLE